MKQDINPVVAAVLVVIALAVAGFFIWRAMNPPTHYGEKPPGIPPSVAAEFQRRMGGLTPPNGKVPQSGNNASMPTGGYIAPPSH